MDTDLLREIGSLDDSFDEDYDNSKFAIKGCLRGGLFNYVFDLPNVCKLICDEIKLVNLDSQNDLKTKYANLFNYFRHDMGCYFSNMLNESFFSYPQKQAEFFSYTALNNPLQCNVLPSK